jgi:hypothetical protein
MRRHFPSSRFTKPSFRLLGYPRPVDAARRDDDPIASCGVHYSVHASQQGIWTRPKAGLGLCVEAAGFVSDPGGPTRPAPIEDSRVQA